MANVKLEDIQAAPINKDRDPALVIEMPGKKLSVGKHRFQLVVVDDSGNESLPDSVEVIVIDDKNPTAVLDLQTVAGRTIPENRIPYGSGFRLYGKRSTDAGGGRIVKYIWKMVS